MQPAARARLPPYMGLLSLFNLRTSDSERSDAHAEPIAETEPQAGEQELLWRLGAVETYALGEHVQAVHRGKGPPQVFPSFALEFASTCLEWKPLRAHVAYYADRHGWDSLQIDSLSRVLPELQAAGVLISSAEVLQQLGRNRTTSANPPPAISIIGFPTGGNRVALLERAIRSFAANLREYRREAEFLVADSSANPEHTAAFRSRLVELATELKVPVAFCAQEEKQAFARELAKANACSYEAAEFALLDPLETGFACGANRNALLLHGAGRMLCSIDDDVVCDLFRPPDTAQRLALFSNRDPFSRWLFRDLASAEEFAQPAAADFLGAHELMLGRSVGELVDGMEPVECDFENLRDRVLQRLEGPPLKVRSTFLGHLGDPGIPSSVYYLYYDRENRRRLTETEEHYRSVFGSRSVQTIVPTQTIGDASVSPGMAMGLDHREVLPPFFPVLHAEDFSWGAAVWQCCGNGLLGHVPLAIRHAPPMKSILTPSDFGPDKPVVVFEWAHLLRYLLLKFEPASGASDTQRMIALGRYLSDFAGLSGRDFEHAIGESILRFESERISWLERELREDTETPEYWREDLERHLDHVRASLAKDDFDIPLDLKPKGTPAEMRAFMQQALARYGQLLQEWPAMVQGAAALRDRSFPLFR